LAVHNRLFLSPLLLVEVVVVVTCERMVSLFIDFACFMHLYHFIRSL